MSEPIDINDFKRKRPEWVFECTCGSQLFFLNHDGTIECRSCKNIRESIECLYRNGMKPISERT
jgi:hypothetical protein